MKNMPQDWPLDAERTALGAMQPVGFQLRDSPPASELADFITDDSKLFQVSHMGLAQVEREQWVLRIDGMVERPLLLDWDALQALPFVELTSVHECFGSPLKPPLEPLVRVGNVVWRGVRLCDVLQRAGVLPGAAYIWSEGLDHGQFDHHAADRYQKDLPLQKALSPEVLLAYALNGEPLACARGGPVRLVVPGFFGTNSTKWLCRISVQDHRASGTFITLYHERETIDGQEVASPIWEIPPHAFFTWPYAGARLIAGRVALRGWAWAGVPIVRLDISVDAGRSWQAADLTPRREFEWQGFAFDCDLPPGPCTLMCRATDAHGAVQPMSPRRNQVDTITLDVLPPQDQGFQSLAQDQGFP